MAVEIASFNKWSNGQISNTNAILLAIYNQLFGGAGGTPTPGLFRNTAQQRIESITTVGGADSIALDDFAGCVVLAIYAKLAGGAWVNINGAAGYTPVGVNNLDTVMLTQAFQDSETINDFNLNFSLTGIGSTVTCTGGTLDQSQPAIVIYYNNTSFTNTSSSTNMIPFTSVTNQDTYNLGSALSGMNIAWVMYGDQIISKGSFSVSGTSLTINVGGPVQGGLACFVVPQT